MSEEILNWNRLQSLIHVADDDDDNKQKEDEIGGSRKFRGRACSVHFFHFPFSLPSGALKRILSNSTNRRLEPSGM
jgi:hypothetical protein